MIGSHLIPYVLSRPHSPPALVFAISRGKRQRDAARSLRLIALLCPDPTQTTCPLGQFLFFAAHVGFPSMPPIDSPSDHTPPPLNSPGESVMTSAVCWQPGSSRAPTRFRLEFLNFRARRLWKKKNGQLSSPRSIACGQCAGRTVYAVYWVLEFPISLLRGAKYFRDDTLPRAVGKAMPTTRDRGRSSDQPFRGPQSSTRNS
jgi:hypothetical protein